MQSLGCGRPSSFSLARVALILTGLAAWMAAAVVAAEALVSAAGLSPPRVAVAAAAAAAALEVARRAAGGDVAPVTLLGTWASPSAARALRTFGKFYPKYLREHSRVGTKRLHYAGTVLLLLQLALTPSLAAALAAAAAVGLALFPWLQFTSTGAVEAAAVIAVYAAATAGLPTAARLGPLVAGYGCAWVGHFFIERNRPATFIYPTFSLIGDLRMFGDMLLGMQPL